MKRDLIHNSTVHDFYCATDECGPWGGVTVDAAGNLYGTTGGGARAPSIH